MRIDKRVKALFPYLSNSQIEEALRSGLVKKPDGGLLKKGDKDDIALDTQDLQKEIALSKQGNPNLNVSVVYEAPGFWVVDKPAGVATHPLRISDRNTLTHWAISRAPSILKEFLDFQPTITPHRLDTDTSGLVVVARNVEEFERWRHRFSNAKVTKNYLAWCWGSPNSNRFECHSAIGHDPKNFGRMIAIASGEKYAEPALTADTFIEVKAKRADRFLAQVHCTTGVTHQVRVHLAALGFPLLGDSLYDTQFANRPYQGQHHLLKASKIIVESEGLTFEADSSQFEKLF